MSSEQDRPSPSANPPAGHPGSLGHPEERSQDLGRSLHLEGEGMPPLEMATQTTPSLHQILKGQLLRGLPCPPYYFFLR